MPGLSRDYNPFANLDLHIPSALHEDIKRYTTTDGDAGPELTPFDRYVDLWAAGVAVGAEERAYVSLSQAEQRRFIPGAVLQGDLTRIEFLQFVAIAHDEDPFVVTNPRRVIEIADAYAAGGLPIIIDWLQGGVQTPILGVTKGFIKYLNEHSPAAS